ncbi:sensor histidine kinase [Massilia pseudoviolaceinigra]|uniref:sensor histidine kinase n=1 Tax=Massilia pseudoviolaceinigra TaxID=3057165 RepID=UPI002796BA5D|nr:HAMP domain-containing sensor histidine kinase [Massilia sp. CCM 9206]MDQ1923260.1 HAMP domain-containing sensor histidine kinase [Massilia sp. CCM 9206]
MKIRSFLAMMIVAALAPVILFSTVPLSRLIQAERDAAVLSMKLAARATSIAVDSQWHQAIGLIRGLSSSNKLESGQLAQFGIKARTMAGSEGAYIELFDDSGQLLVDTTLAPDGPLPDTRARQRARVDRMLSSSAYAISDLQPGKLPDSYVVQVDYPVFLDNGVRYVLGYGFDVDDLMRALPAPDADGTNFAVYDRNGRLLASNGKHAAVGSFAPAPLLVAIRLRESGLVSTPDGRYAMLTASTVSGWWVAMSSPRATIDGTARRTVIYSVSGLIIALLLAGAAALLFSARVTKAIARTGEAARSMVAGPARLPLYSGITEVDRLDQNVYLGAHLLASASAERERLLSEAQQAREIAEGQNRSKDEFLAMLGHELRNPMAPISTAAHLLRMPNISPEQMRQAGDIISRQVDHMNHLVNDLLDVSRVTRGLITLEKKPVSLRAILAAAVEQTMGSMHKSGHRFETVCGEEEYWVRGDATRLIQVLTNLLVNAAKYSPPQSSIRVTLARDGERISIEVSDDGNGIEPELLPRIFELFSQGRRTPDRATGGLGLGLALVRKLVELHGGSVIAYSEGVGKGSRFTIELPAADMRAADLAADTPVATAAIG